MRTAGNIVTQVQRQFNGLGQLTREWQSHSGAANTSTTLKVQYAYSEMAGGANHSRLTTMTRLRSDILSCAGTGTIHEFFPLVAR